MASAVKKFFSKKKKKAEDVSGDGMPGPADLSGESGSGEMPFLDHLEELRWRIMKGIAGVLLGTVVCVIFTQWVVDVLLLGPTQPDFFMYKFFGIELEEFVLQNRTITGQFFAYLGTVIVVGIILGSPVFLYQMWAFIEPGLYESEKSKMRFVSLFATFFFMTGVAFGYLIITPLAMNFFSSFELSATISNEFDITKYFSMITIWSLGAGLLFELPVVIYFLSKMGVVTPELLRSSRKYAVIIILMMAAFLTPPDPVTQVLMAIPLFGLYEMSIWISAKVQKKRAKELEEALA